jgi:hypothetical protein
MRGKAARSSRENRRPPAIGDSIEPRASRSAGQASWSCRGIKRACDSPDQRDARRLLDLYNAWRLFGTTAERRRILDEMLEVWSQQVYSISLTGAVPQPVIVNDRLRNVPEKAIFNWEPGAQFGIHRPDTFWFANQAK